MGFFQMGYVILTALGLFLIFEGILPFLLPRLWRRMVIRAAMQSNLTLHIVGFICLLIGVGLIFISHHYFLAKGL